MKRDIDNVMEGLDYLSAMLTVFGTYASQYPCETDDAEVSPHIRLMAYDLMADYASILREQLEDLQYPNSPEKIPENIPGNNIRTMNKKSHIG